MTVAQAHRPQAMQIMPLFLILFFILTGCATREDHEHDAAVLKFSFQSIQAASRPIVGQNVTNVSVDDVFSQQRGYGFDLDTRPVSGDECVTSSKPFFFSVVLPEGNFNVKATFGDGSSATTNTVKAEMRRLVLEQVITKPGEFITREITVNIRTPAIRGGGQVRLKQREQDDEIVNWDNKLTLEFNGSNPSLVALEVRPAHVPTLFLLGDSTVCDQPAEPWNSWGQMLPRFFKPSIAVANYASSGESIKSSLAAGRFDKVFSLMKSNDWLFVQFGHNDMKDKTTNALAVYESNLRKIIVRTRKKGGTPVLITSMERKAGVEKPTLARYPEIVRKVAKEEGVALIDLNKMSLTLYEALGTNINAVFQDSTHHNNYGSYELARCVVVGIRKELPELASYLADIPIYDPAQPDSPDTFHMVASPQRTDVKPEGN